MESPASHAADRAAAKLANLADRAAANRANLAADLADLAKRVAS